MSTINVIKVSELEVKYDKATILKNVNLNIKKGEIVGFLGPSGSGKTTLVKALIGMKAPTKGEIEVLGEKMPSLEVIAQVGYMAQSDALYDDLSAIDNLLFFGELYNLKGKAAKTRAMELLTLVSLEKDATKAVRNYSGGMKRRLSLAISLIHSPELLILDEPTVGIDPVLRRSFWNEFKRIKNNGGTIIITTHVMDEAYNCDRLSLIRDGEIIADGSPDEIISSSGTANIEEAFLYYSDGKREV
jgi:ABC-2 type transport system ATP-binding protein